MAKSGFRGEFSKVLGVLSIAKWSPFFVSVIGSAVSEIYSDFTFLVFT